MVQPFQAALSKETPVKFSLVISFVLGMVWVYSWLDGRFDAQAKIMSEQRDLIRDISYEVQSIKKATEDRFTIADMRLFISELQRRNPTMTVPSVETILMKR